MLALVSTGCFDRGKQIRKTAWDGDAADLARLIKAYPALIDSQAAPAAPPSVNATPLSMAIGSTLQELFLDKRSSFEAADAEGDTALHLAAQLGNVEIVKTLIDGGANINATNQYGATPLLLASFHRQREIMLTLIRAGARIDVRTPYGITPLHMVAGYGSPGNPELLMMLKSGVPAGMTNGAGVSPLHTAARNNQTNAMAMLLDFHAPIDAADSRLDTPLHLAARNHALEAVRLLLARGANPNARNYYGETPLFASLTIQRRSSNLNEDSGFPVVEALLKSHARIDVTNTLGETPISLTKSKSNLRLLKLLENSPRANE